jgi:DNA-binding MarR family transcriptional regulator
VLLTISSMYCTVMDDSAATALTGAQRGDVAGRHTGVDDSHADDAAGLSELAYLVQGTYARVSQRHDLTPVQARLLCILADGPRGMAELARCFEVEKAALTGLIDRAERRGLVKRSRVPGDRRALRVTPTDTGRRAAAAFHAEVNAELSELLAPLPPDDREHFRNTMAEILQLSRTNSRAPERPHS